MMWIGFSLAISIWGSRYFLCLDAYFSSRFGNHSAINLSNIFSILFFKTLSQLFPLLCGSLGSVSWMYLRVLEDFDYAYLVLFPYMCLMSWPCPLSLTFFFLCFVMSVDDVSHCVSFGQLIHFQHFCLVFLQILNFLSESASHVLKYAFQIANNPRW